MLRDIGRYLRIPTDDRELEETIDSFRFDRLSGGRPAVQENPNSFYRKGVVGDHTNHFDRFDRLLMRRAAGREMEILGYDPR